MFKILLLAAFIPAIFSQFTFHPCTQGETPTDVRVLGCDSPRCDLILNEETTIEVDFTAPSDTASLTAFVNAHLGILQLPFDLPEDVKNACNHLLDGSCPVAQGDELVYSLTMLVEAPVSDVEVSFEVFLIDDAGARVFCFMADATILP